MEIEELKSRRMNEIGIKSSEEMIYSSSKNFCSSNVLNTCISDCFLKCESFDQIGIPSSKARAKKGTSVLCEINLDALTSDSWEEDTNSIIFGSNDSLYSNSFLVILDFEQMVSEYLLSSFSNSLGENSSIEYDLINFEVYDSFLNNDMITLVSTTNFIFDQELEFSSMSSFSFLPILIQSSSVSSEFSRPFLNSSNTSSCFILLANASLAIEDQLSHSNLSILFLNSSGIDKVKDDIFTSYTYNMYYMFNNILQVFKLFGLEGCYSISVELNKEIRI